MTAPGKEPRLIYSAHCRVVTRQGYCAEILVRAEEPGGPWSAVIRNIEGEELELADPFPTEGAALAAGIARFELTPQELGDPEPQVSPLCQQLTRNGVTIEVHIYSAPEGGWLMHVVDAAGNLHDWPAPFETDEDALQTAIAHLERDTADFDKPIGSSSH